MLFDLRLIDVLAEPQKHAYHHARIEAAYSPASEMKVPADFLAAVERKPKLKAFFAILNKSSRYVIAYGLSTAKRPETRQRRFEKFIDMLARKEKPDFGFSKGKKDK